MTVFYCLTALAVFSAITYLDDNHQKLLHTYTRHRQSVRVYACFECGDGATFLQTGKGQSSNLDVRYFAVNNLIRKRGENSTKNLEEVKASFIP
jgi:hypothetical protein